MAVLKNTVGHLVHRAGCGGCLALLSKLLHLFCCNFPFRKRDSRWTDVWHPGRLLIGCSCTAVRGLEVALCCFLGKRWCYTGMAVIIQDTLGISPKVSVASFPLTLSAPLLLISLSFLSKLAVPLHQTVENVGRDTHSIRVTTISSQDSQPLLLSLSSPPSLPSKFSDACIPWEGDDASVDWLAFWRHPHWQSSHRFLCKGCHSCHPLSPSCTHWAPNAL